VTTLLTWYVSRMILELQLKQTRLWPQQASMSSFHPIESIFTPVSLIRNHSNFSTTSTTTKAKSEPVANPNPRSTTYEFMGPPGAFLISFGVPFMTYLLYFGCSEESGNCPPLQSIPDRFVEVLSDETFGASLWNTKASLIYLGW